MLLTQRSQRYFFFSSRRRHTRWNCDWSSDVCSSDLTSVISALKTCLQFKQRRDHGGTQRTQRRNQDTTEIHCALNAGGVDNIKNRMGQTRSVSAKPEAHGPI